MVFATKGLNMEWIQVITIIASLGGFMFFILQRLEKDIDGLSRRMDNHTARMDSHAARIDQLYKMFCDLLQKQK